ncbi:MAG: SprT-like domain-containing protein [Candidatus Thiodiazotropha sp.]|jgi:SprT protein
MHDKNLQLKTIAKTRQLLNSAERHFSLPPIQPVILFNLTGKAAGQVVLHRQGHSKIRYNTSLLERYGSSFIEQTVPHEVAHLIAHTLHGQQIKPHGTEWKAIMHFYRAVPNRCHHFDTSQSTSRTMRYYEYQCDCRTHHISAIRHNRILSGIPYSCLSCGSMLVIAGDPT